MQRSHVKIILSQNPQDCQLLINGQNVPFAGVDIRARAGEFLTAKIDMVVDEIVLEGEYMSDEEMAKKYPEINKIIIDEPKYEGCRCHCHEHNDNDHNNFDNCPSQLCIHCHPENFDGGE